MDTAFQPQLLNPEQQQSLKQQALLQAEANVENARINYLMALAALHALQSDGPGSNGASPPPEK